MVRKLLGAAVALLGGFHAWLFAAQVADGRLADPTTIARWLVAFGVAGLIWHLRRNQTSLFWGRKATAVWLLAAVLHAPAAARGLDAADGWATADVAGTVLQVSAVAGLAALAVAAIFLSRLRRPLLIVGLQISSDVGVHRCVRTFLPIAPRPPPIR